MNLKAKADSHKNDSFISNTYDIFFNLSLSDNITMLFWKAGHKRLFGVSKCTYLIQFKTTALIRDNAYRYYGTLVFNLLAIVQGCLGRKIFRIECQDVAVWKLKGKVNKSSPGTKPPTCASHLSCCVVIQNNVNPTNFANWGTTRFYDTTSGVLFEEQIKPCQTFCSSQSQQVAAVVKRRGHISNITQIEQNMVFCS